MLDPIATCAYCGQNFPAIAPHEQMEIIAGHMSVCIAHPMRQLEKENKELQAHLDNLLEEIKALRKGE